MRLGLFIATIAYIVYLQQNPELIQEIKEAGVKSHDDIIQWGKEKIAFNFTNISQRTITYNPKTPDEDHEEEGSSRDPQIDRESNATPTEAGEGNTSTQNEGSADDV